MKQRKTVLISLFNREFFAMKIYYNIKSRKDKSKKNKSFKLFDQAIDEECRDMLIDEYFQICKKFCRLNLLIKGLIKPAIQIKINEAS